jgi:hypothetical protein
LDQAYDRNGTFQDSLYMEAYHLHMDEENLRSGGRVQSHRGRGQGGDESTGGISARGRTTAGNSRTSIVLPVPSVTREESAGQILITIT